MGWNVVMAPLGKNFLQEAQATFMPTARIRYHTYHNWVFFCGGGGLVPQSMVYTLLIFVLGT